MPAGRVDPGRLRALGERPVAVVPEQRVVRSVGTLYPAGRHVEVRVAVEVEVGRDAAVPAQLQVRRPRGG